MVCFETTVREQPATVTGWYCVATATIVTTAV